MMREPRNGIDPVTAWENMVDHVTYRFTGVCNAGNIFSRSVKPMDTNVKRGDIFYADLSPVVGSEQGGTRPVLIVQNDMETATHRR